METRWYFNMQLIIFVALNFNFVCIAVVNHGLIEFIFQDQKKASEFILSLVYVPKFSQKDLLDLPFLRPIKSPFMTHDNRYPEKNMPIKSGNQGILDQEGFSKLPKSNKILALKTVKANGYEMGSRIYLLFWWRCKSSDHRWYERRRAKYSSALDDTIELAIFQQGHFYIGTNWSSTEKCGRIRKLFQTVQTLNSEHWL